MPPEMMVYQAELDMAETELGEERAKVQSLEASLQQAARADLSPLRRVLP